MSEEKVMITYSIKVIMKEKFKEKIDWISSYYDKEVNGFITGKIEEGNIILEDLLIPFQESGVGSAEVTGANLVKLKKEYKNECKKIIGEWHSHHSMGVHWSSDDEKVINDFANPRETTIFIVSSKGDHLVRVELRKPFKLSVDNLPYETEASDSKISKVMQKEIEKKVKVPTDSGIRVIDFRGKGKKKYYTEEEKDIRQEVNSMVKFYNKRNIVEVIELNYYQKSALENDFIELKPEVFIEDEVWILKFNFKDKKKAKKTMKQIKESLVDILIQENESNALEEVSMNWWDKHKDFGGNSNYKSYFG